MRVVLLAAGFGTRLYPLTRDRAKPLLEVRGRPVLSWLLEKVLEIDGIEELVVVTNAKFHRQFLRWRDGPDPALPGQLPLRVIDDGATDDAERLGAVVDLALGMADFPPASDVLMLAGDNLIDGGLGSAARVFRSSKQTLVLVRDLGDRVPPGRHGEVTVDASGWITRFREKPRAPESNLVSTSIYFLTPEACALCRDYVKSDGDKDTPGQFLAWLMTRTPVRALPLEGRLFDIGSLETLEEARRYFRP
ncbi:MAG: nucleotidyltransferase family protein [Planctomycetota bacterium]